MNPHVMMIGGGIQEIPAVERARSLGYQVIVTDRNPRAPCFSLADVTAVIDGTDVEGLTLWTQRHLQSLGIVAVFTFTELVTSVAAVAQAARLPGVPTSSAMLCQDKGLCKQRWLAQAVRTPGGEVVENQQQTLEAFRRLKGNAYIKPTVGFGGQGIERLRCEDDVASYFFRREASSAGRVWVIEEALDGTMHDVNGLITSDGNFHPLGIVDRFFLEDRPVEKEIRAPTRLHQEMQLELYSLLEEGVRALGMDFGPVKGDAVVHEGGCSLLEVAPRLHGPKNSLYLLPMAGYEPFVPVLRTLAGEKHVFHQTGPPEIGRAAACRAILPLPGRSVNPEKLQKAAQMEGIEHVMTFEGSGVVTRYQDSTQVPGYVFARANSEHACQVVLDCFFAALGCECL